MQGNRAGHSPRTARTALAALMALSIRRRGRVAWPLLLLTALWASLLPAAHPSSVDASNPRDAAPAGAWAWGADNAGQLGNNSTTQSTSPTAVNAISNVVAIAAGGDHSLALTADGTVWGWGANKSGQIGDGTTSQRNAPVRVSPATAFTAGALPTSSNPGPLLAAGGSHSLAVKSDGTLWAWGDNTYGQLGLGNGQVCGTACPPGPVAFPAGFPGVKAVAAGLDHSLALDTNGSVWAWGSNKYAQLGLGPSHGEAQDATPQQVPGLPTIVAIAAGANFSLALDSSGTVWAWGDDSFGQLGETNYSTPVNTPQQVAGLSGIKAIAAGPGHALALDSGGAVWAWGVNNDGQLGETLPSACTLPSGSLPCSVTPVQVQDQSQHAISGVTAIAAGGSYNSSAPGGFGLALLSNGTVYGWGEDDKGQLGDGSPTAYRAYAVTTSGLSGVSAVAAGNNQSLAIAAGLTVSLSTTSLNFGAQVVGQTSAPQPVTITNTSASAVTIGAVTLTQPSTYISGFGTPPFGGNLAPCQNISLPPGSSCTVTVTYTPAGVGTSTGGTLTFDDNAAGGPHTVALGGSGVSSATTSTPTAASGTSTGSTTVSLSTSSIDFGNVASGSTSAAQSVVVTDNGPGSVTISNIAITNPTAPIAGITLPFLEFNQLPGGCQIGTTLTAGSQCAIQLTFTPSTVYGLLSSGTQYGSLTITDNSANSPHTVNLTAVIGSVSATSTPTTVPGSTPTATATVTPTATFVSSPVPTLPSGPTATSTPRPTARPTKKPSHPTSKTQCGKSGTSCKPSPPSLNIGMTPARVISGNLLTIRVRTSAGARVDSRLQVTGTKEVYVGTGKKRHKVKKTVVLTGVSFGGSADDHGQFIRLVRVEYNPAKPAQASLIVTARTSHGKTTRSAHATILPRPKATHKKATSKATHAKAKPAGKK